MLFPEHAKVTACKSDIKWILWGCCIKRRVFTEHNEQNHSHSEDIDLFSFVFSAQMDFWCHVPKSSEGSLEVSGAVSALDRGSEPEINDFGIELRIQHNILWLQVSVSDSLLMAMVKALSHLFKIVA